MPFYAANHEKTKQVLPGKEFPIHMGSERNDVAILAVDKDKPDELHVTLLGADIIVKPEGGDEVSSGETTIVAKDFTIRHKNGGKPIKVEYSTPADEFSLQD